MCAKRLKRLKRLPGARRAKAKLPQQKLDRTRFDRTEDEEDKLASRLGSRRLAQKVLKLKKKYPAATVPELVCVEFLERRLIDHRFQIAMLGGRTRQGGLVPDLVLFVGPTTVVWMVHGNYWHLRPEKRRRDQAQREALKAAAVEGRRCDYVVEIWERRLMDPRLRNQVLEAGLLGIELGP